jgi:hypothetical protein
LKEKVIKMKIAFTLIALAGMASATYRQKLDVFSFDTQFGEYPLTYKQFGSTVGLKSKVKLIPAASQTEGALFLN